MGVDVSVTTGLENRSPPLLLVLVLVLLMLLLLSGCTDGLNIETPVEIGMGTKVDGSEAAMLWILPFTAPRCTNNSVLDLPRNLYIQYSASFRQEMFYNITGKYHLKSQSKARLATAPQQRY